MNRKRRAIWNKSNGKCFYCGVSLGEKGWHEDHFHPIFRGMEIKGDRFVTNNECLHPDLDCEENKVPSCAPCNIYKSSMSISGFRGSIETAYATVRSRSTHLRQLERMGMIQEPVQPVEFYFEKQGINPPSRDDLLGISRDAKGIEWKKDDVDDCYHASISGKVVTLRHIQGVGYLSIATWDDWQQERVNIKNMPLHDAKVKAAQWAMDLQH